MMIATIYLDGVVLVSESVFVKFSALYLASKYTVLFMFYS